MAYKNCYNTKQEKSIQQKDFKNMHYVQYVQIFNHNISLQKQHGKPTNTDSRHVGDLGNIVTPPSRFTLVSLFDGLISLDAEAENGIAGRAFVVHAGEDDLGMI